MPLMAKRGLRRFFIWSVKSEPQAGSGLGDITARAVADRRPRHHRQHRPPGAGQGARRRWSAGGGTKGISLFIVAKVLEGTARSVVRNDIAVAGLDHKMGYRGTANCLFNFGEGRSNPFGKPGAIGYLIGGVGQQLPISSTADPADKGSAPSA